MATKWLDLVVVKNSAGQKVIRKAPGFSGLQEGDEVMIEISDHPYVIRGTVVGSLVTEEEREDYAFIKAFLGVKDLERIVSKVEYSELEYSDDEYADGKESAANG